MADCIRYAICKFFFQNCIERTIIFFSIHQKWSKHHKIFEKSQRRDENTQKRYFWPKNYQNLNFGLEISDIFDQKYHKGFGKIRNFGMKMPKIGIFDRKTTKISISDWESVIFPIEKTFLEYPDYCWVG